MTRTLSFGLLVLFVASSLHAGDEKTWEGKWNNKKRGSSGPMKCVAKEVEPGKWKATFSGKFQGEGFSYDVDFNAKPGKGQTDLSGTAVIRGHDYTWTGSIKRNQLKGAFKSSIDFGDFALVEPKKK